MSKSTVEYPFSARLLKDMLPVLMSPEAVSSADAPAYYVVRGPEEAGMVGPNITVLLPGKVGQEFVKTFGHYHQHGEGERYKVLMGEALCLLQRKDSTSGKITEVKAIVAPENSFIEVPSGYAHLLVNTTDALLITADWESAEAGHLYGEIKKNRGFAYYIIEDGDRTIGVPNILYGNIPELKWEYL